MFNIYCLTLKYYTPTSRECTLNSEPSKNMCSCFPFLVMARSERIKLLGGVRQRSQHPDIRCLGISQCLQAVKRRQLLQCLQAVTRRQLWGWLNVYKLLQGGNCLQAVTRRQLPKFKFTNFFQSSYWWGKSKQLYIWVTVCTFVGWSVGRSVGRQVGR